MRCVNLQGTLYRKTGFSNKFIAGVFHQFNGFTKFSYLPDAM